MAFTRHLPIFLAIGLVITPSLIANETIGYSCSTEAIKNMTKQKAPIQNDLSMQSRWAIPLNINRMLPTQPRRQDNQNLAFLHPRGKECNNKILFLPVSPAYLKFPYVEVLPNQEVCLNGRLLQKKCMPKDPVAFAFVLRGNVGSLIVSSSYYSSK